VLIVMPRAFSSGAASIWSYALASPPNFGRQHRRDRRRQRRLAVVHVTNRAHVHVRLGALKLAFCHASASPGSGARMKASPTRKACTPAARMRCTSAGQDARLGDQQAVGRHPRQQVQRGLQRDLEGAQVAVVDAHQRRLQPQRAVELGAVVHLHQHGHAEASAQASRSAIGASSRQAAISRMQSAPWRAPRRPGPGRP
jgi:hypothetical protein